MVFSILAIYNNSTTNLHKVGSRFCKILNKSLNVLPNTAKSHQNGKISFNQICSHCIKIRQSKLCKANMTDDTNHLSQIGGNINVQLVSCLAGLDSNKLNNLLYCKNNSQYFSVFESKLETSIGIVMPHGNNILRLVLELM